VVTASNSTIRGKLSLSTVKCCLFNEKACRKKTDANIDETLVTEDIG